ERFCLCGRFVRVVDFVRVVRCSSDAPRIRSAPMMRNRRMLTLWKLSTRLAPLALVAVGLLAVAARVHAQNLPFNVRLGLWELTSTSHRAGVPMPDLSSLPP